jgi:hypothetical protein
MTLPGFTAEESLYKEKGEYKSYLTYFHQKNGSISPAYLNFRCLRCLIRCNIICSPPRMCLVSCPQQCSGVCGAPGP